MAPFLELRGITKSFPGFVLGPLSTKLMAGRILGVLGPNGAGKTTLLNLITLQTKSSSGELLHGGRRVAWGDARWKARFAYVREVPSFYSELTVAETLRLSARLYGQWDSDLASRMTQRLGLNARQQVSTLSKGTRVKLGIVSALAHRADVLILDEPTAGVDPTAREELHAILVELRRDRPELCVVLSSHIFEDLENSADDVIILRDGRIVFESSRECLRTMSLYRLPEAIGTPTFDEAPLTWLADGHRWVMTSPDSATGLRLRAVPGCVLEASERLLPSLYRGTSYLAEQDRG